MLFRRRPTSRATASVGGALQWAQMFRTAHILPGRLRLRFKSLKGDSVKAATLQQQLSEVAGISRAEVNAATGSLLLHYDHHLLESPAFLNAISEALGQAFPGQFAPGRLHLVVKPLKGNKELAGWIVRCLSPVAGIERLELDPGTGALLLVYDPHEVTKPAFIKALMPRIEELLPGLDVQGMFVRAGFKVR